MTPFESKNRDNSIEFLLAEYNQITEETRRLRGEGLNRLNFFITLTSSILGGLVLFSQLNVASAYIIQLVSLVALVFLALVGWTTFSFTISRDINTDFNLRSTGRIRRFFVDLDPELSRYLTWQDHDEPTPWVTRNNSNLRGTTQSILALLLALVAGLIANLILANIVWSTAIGIFSFAVMLIILILYAKKRFDKARQAAQDTIRFPKTITLDS